MKIAIAFLTIFVAISHQQYRQRMFMGFPLPFFQPVYNRNFLNSRHGYVIDSLVGRYNSFKPIIFLINTSGEKKSKTEKQYTPEENKYPDIQPRFRSSSQNQQDNQKLNPRFLFNLFGLTTTSSFGNFLLKTVTLTISSTCTALSFVTCVPRANINPAAPAAVITCVRKRQIDLAELISNDDNQFPITPSQVRQVESTMQPNFSRNPRQTSIKIASSKGESAGIEENQLEELLRNKRFYYLWQSFATATTITSWSVISSVSTSTLIPRDALGAAANLPCLPAGFTVCAQTGK